MKRPYAARSVPPASLPQDRPHPLLNLRGAIALILGVVIGTGMFKSPAMVAGMAGNVEWMCIAWALGGVISLLGALCYAELITDDTLYDLGCGAGRVVITAAKERGARGNGIDLNTERNRVPRCSSLLGAVRGNTQRSLHAMPPVRAANIQQALPSGTGAYAGLCQSAITNCLM